MSMSPEEYQRIKDAEKEHLRKLKKLKQQVRLAERKRKVSQTMADMATSASDSLDTHREMLDRLAMDTVRSEARLEIALESAEAAEAEAEVQQRQIEMDETLQRARAQSLLRQLKQEMGAPLAEPDAARPRDADKTIGRTPRPAPEAAKTIGRTPMSSQPDASASGANTPGPKTSESPKAAPPDKTIGRRRSS